MAMTETATHVPHLSAATTELASSSRGGDLSPSGAKASAAEQPQARREGEIRNRARFEAALVGILGPDMAPRGPAAGRLYEVFVSYFLHQALHHDKALSAHRLTLTLLGDPTGPEKGRRLKYSMAGEEREPNAFLQALRAAANAAPLSLSSSSAGVPTRLGGGGGGGTVGEGTPFLQSDEKFFAMATTWLGDDLCLALKALLRRVKISFVATRFLEERGKKIWVNWEWVGSLHGDSSAHALGSNERWDTIAVGRQHGAIASPIPAYRPLRMEAGTPEEGGLRGPASVPASWDQATPPATLLGGDSQMTMTMMTATTAPHATDSHPTVVASQPPLFSSASASLSSDVPVSYCPAGLTSHEPAAALMPETAIPVLAPPAKEKRSLGRKITRRFHKLTHHHHHQPPTTTE